MVAIPEDFARALRVLKQRSGLSLRGLAARLGRSDPVPTATLADWFAGKHLPTSASTEALTRLLGVLGRTDPDDIAEWLAALDRVRVLPGPRAAAAAPFRGLACYEAEHADLFYGRETMVAELVALVRRRHARGRPSIVIGPSGSGKSSLLRAGLVPALAESHFLFTPGRDPGAALADARRAAAEASKPLLVLVDQAEELFTADVDQVQRMAFVEDLCALPAGPDSSVSVVFGLRSDFYSPALLIPGLAEALQDGQLIVGPMSEADLRSVLTGPARRKNVSLDSGLVELLIREMAPAGGALGAHDPGALPLLSHALLATWESGRRRTLTVEDYIAAGRIDGAIAKTAEDAYNALSAAQQEAARMLFLRLVRTDEDNGDTRRRMLLAEVGDVRQGDLSGDLAAVLDHFVVARLLTVDDESIEIAHEALLSAWPRLQGWLSADRTWLQLHQRLNAATRDWLASDRDLEALDRGPLLQLTRTWVADGGHDRGLSAVEREFLAESIRAADAAKVREQRRSRRRTRLIALFAVLVVLAGAVTAYARQERVTSDRERSQALSRLVADESNRLRGHDVSLAMQLSLAAYDISPTPEAASSLLDATGVTAETRLGPGSGADAAVFATAGALVAIGTKQGPVRVARLADGGTPAAMSAPLPGTPSAATAMSFGSHGAVLASAAEDGRTWLWNTAAPEHPSLLAVLAGIGEPIDAVGLSPDGSVLAEGTKAGTVLVWRVADLKRSTAPIAVLNAFGNHVTTLAFSPDGSLLAVSGYDFTTRLWRLTRPDHPDPLASITTSATRIFGLAFSPDGRVLAGGAAAGHDVYLWDVAHPSHPDQLGAPLAGPGSWVDSVAFSPDGRTLAAGSADGRLWLFDVASGRAVAQLPHTHPVTEVEYREDGTPLTLTDDGALHWWRLPGPTAAGFTDSVFSVEFDANDGRFAVIPGAGENTASIWDTSSPHHPVRLGTPIAGVAGPGKFSGGGDLSTDGAVLYLGTADGSIQTWDVADPEHPVRTELTRTAGDLINSVAVEPGGSLLAASSDDGTFSVLNTADPRHPVVVATMTPPSKVQLYQVTFSPDRRTLAVGSLDGHSYLYDISEPAAPVLVSALGGFTGTAYTAAFDSTGRMVAVGSADGTIGLWDTSDPRHPVQRGRKLVGPIGYIYGLAFAPGRSVLAASGSEDGEIWMWDVADPSHPAHTVTLAGSANGVYTVVFSADGRTLAAGGTDGAAQFWDVDVAAARTWICSVIGEPITPEVWAQYVPGAEFRPVCAGR
ncbi:MAG: helix-turn-helix domain-containing protein [Catenulispora sp.]